MQTQTFFFVVRMCFGCGSAPRHQFAAIMQGMSIPVSAEEVSSAFRGIQEVRDNRLSKRVLTEWFIGQKKKLSDPKATSWLRGKVGSYAQLRLRLWNWWRQSRGQVSLHQTPRKTLSLLQCTTINAPSLSHHRQRHHRHKHTRRTDRQARVDANIVQNGHPRGATSG